MIINLTSTVVLVLGACIAIANAQLNWNNSSWIWSSDASSPPTTRPIEQRAFRKVISTNACNPPSSVEIMLTADDAFTLYVNGLQVGSGSNWNLERYFCVQVTAQLGNRVVIAVAANNTQANTLAGVIASGRVNNVGGGSIQFVTDASWRSSLIVPSGFQDPNYDDCAWPAAVVEEGYNGTSWVPNLPVSPNQTCSLCPAGPTIF